MSDLTQGQLAQQAQRLRELVECSGRIHASPSLEEMVAAIAVEARALFGASEVSVEVDAHGDLPALTRVATELDGGGATEGDGLVQALRDGQGRRLGRIVLHGGAWIDPRIDAAALEQFARLSAIALENASLLRASVIAAQARDEVLAVVSHDLRSPLGTVSMGAAMLRRSLTAPNDVEIVNRIARSCKRMERLIEDLLDASRLDSGSVQVAPRAVEADDLVRAAVDAAAIEAAAGKVTVDAGHIEPLRVMADRDRLLQVFSNLVGNALKFTPKGGGVTITVRRDGEHARFSVADTGPGIAAEHLPHLFNRYWKGERSGRHGAGLGLYIARGLVLAHHGAITAESGDGGGATLSFTLPLAPT